VLALTDLPRLRDFLVAEAIEGATPACFQITFRRDQAGRPVVLGWVRAVLPLACQRCLGVVEVGVDVAIRLLLTPEADLGRDTPEPYEPLPVIDDRVSPVAVVEDELLLALPQVPMHPAGVCSARVHPHGLDRPGPDEAARERPNPFAVLAQWKRDPGNRT